METTAAQKHMQHVSHNYNKYLLDEVEHDIKNSQGRGWLLKLQADIPIGSLRSTTQQLNDAMLIHI